MGFLKRVLQSGQTTSIVDADWYPLYGTGNSVLSVVGEASYQPCITKTMRSAGDKPPLPLDKWPPEYPEQLPWFAAYMHHEPDNQYDANAVCVTTRFGVVGYLARERAKTYVPLLTLLASHGFRGGAASAVALQADNGMWGVVLRVSNAQKCIGLVKADKSFRVE
jgi:hypothetical protein